MKAYYSDYVGHCMRQYRKLKDEMITDEVTINNVETCRRVVNSLPETEREIISTVYTAFPLSEGVNKAVEEHNVRSANLWSMVKNFEKEVARERGLI